MQNRNVTEIEASVMFETLWKMAAPSHLYPHPMNLLRVVRVYAWESWPCQVGVITCSFVSQLCWDKKSTDALVGWIMAPQRYPYPNF